MLGLGVGNVLNVLLSPITHTLFAPIAGPEWTEAMETAKNDQTPELLKELQALPLEAKIALTQVRLDEFYCGYGGGLGYGHGYISFSGGKDSTVLLDIARKRYPEIRACFSNTGLEYPEIRQFALSHDNVDVVYPKMRFGKDFYRYD